MDWIYLKNKWRSSFKFAFLTEQYRYFQNYHLAGFESSRAESFVGKYDLNYKINAKWETSIVIDYMETKGIGSNIGSNIRSTTSASAFVKYYFIKQLGIESSLRQESTAAFQSPLLYAIGINAPLTSHYRIKLNHSKNFRIPTFNDLYWTVGGNQNLKPEQSIQTELGQELYFKGFRIVGTVYHNAIRDLIQWKPYNDTWTPENIGNVKSYGAEFLLEATKEIGTHRVSLTSTYAYTVSTNEDLNTQLTYVPFHKYNANLVYSHRRISLNYQYLFNGAVYTLNDNHTRLEGYKVSNVGVSYSFGKYHLSSIGLKSLNCWNERYQSVPSRPLPGRNFQANLILKF